MPAVGIESIILGVVMTAVSSAIQISGAKKAAKSQVKAVGERADLQARANDRAKRRAIGTAEAGFSKAGVELTGTPLDVLGDIEDTALFNLQSIRLGAETEISRINAAEDAAIGAGIGNILEGFGRGAVGAQKLGFFDGDAAKTGFEIENDFGSSFEGSASSIPTRRGRPSF